MKAISLRLGTETHRAITQEARKEGVSTSTFIREAAYSRAIHQQALRGDLTHLTPELQHAIRQALHGRP